MAESAPVAPLPLRRPPRGPAVVMLGGLLSTAAALLGVYLLDVYAPDFHVMGFYIDYLLPAGAVGVGLVASAGFGLASWLSGVRITGWLLINVLLLQVAAYFAAQYIEFSQLQLVHRDGTPVGFLEWFDVVARSFAWQQHNGSPGTPLGVWGYFFRGLEVLGFSLGSLIVPAVLMKQPYCEQCRVYMRTRRLGVLPASVPARKVKKRDAAALAEYQAQQEQALTQAKAAAGEIVHLAEAGSAPEFRAAAQARLQPAKAVAKVPAHLAVSITRCPRCPRGWLAASLVTRQGNATKSQELLRLELEPAFLEALRDLPKV